ncbi:MAG: hypothetical protein JRC56_03495 [Deltaproteobacteria bacterium]|nr:hypothetical protein [Deltaproteobacteria bacterium]MBW2620382.1 hypothetical protein [Deltaproteobacteria bacterium]
MSKLCVKIMTLEGFGSLPDIGKKRGRISQLWTPIGVSINDHIIKCHEFDRLT